jgi:hypothetical protein
MERKSTTAYAIFSELKGEAYSLMIELYNKVNVSSSRRVTSSQEDIKLLAVETNAELLKNKQKVLTVSLLIILSLLAFGMCIYVVKIITKCSTPFPYFGYTTLLIMLVIIFILWKFTQHAMKNVVQSFPGIAEDEKNNGQNNIEDNDNDDGGDDE